MTSDRLLVAVDPDVRLPFVARDDIGAAAAAAFAEPERFHGAELELAGDVLSFREAAQALSEVLSADIVPPDGPEHVAMDGAHGAVVPGAAAYECASCAGPAGGRGGVGPG
ncbi:NmrA family NAD(P)-binding protein [Actinomadura bangladeshensis]|nr:NmrA family NAD(P)-binding protein [Actinomadura bangladeshensis]